MSSRENAGSPDVETRMVGIELAIFLQYSTIGTFINICLADTYTYRDLLESLQYDTL